MIKGLENLPFEGAELDVAVEAVNIADQLLAEHVGVPVEIEFWRHHRFGHRATARWVIDGIGFVFEAGYRELGTAKDSVLLFDAFIDFVVQSCRCQADSAVEARYAH